MKYVKLFENWLNEAEDASKILETLKKTTIGAFKKASDKEEFLKGIFAKAMQKDPSKFDPNAGSNMKVIFSDEDFRFGFTSEFFQYRPADVERFWGSASERSKDKMQKDQEILKSNNIKLEEVYGPDFSKYIVSKKMNENKSRLRITTAEKLLETMKKNSENLKTEFFKKIKDKSDSDNKGSIMNTIEADIRKLEGMIKFYKDKYPEGKITRIVIDPDGTEEKEIAINITKSMKSSDNADDKSLLDFEFDSYDISDIADQKSKYSDIIKVKPTLGMFMTFLQSYAKGSPTENLLLAGAKKNYNEKIAEIFPTSKGSAATAPATMKKPN